jgi:hypothetical protein
VQAPIDCTFHNANTLSCMRYLIVFLLQQTEFMTLWDGMLSSDKCGIMILGATNRPDSLDE